LVYVFFHYICSRLFWFVFARHVMVKQ